MTMRFYIAGPMTGVKDLNFPAFHAAAKALRDAGYDVVNPAEVNADPTMPWAECMKRDIAQLVACDAVVVLPGHETSRGARLEVHIAKALGMVVLNLHVLVGVPA